MQKVILFCKISLEKQQKMREKQTCPAMNSAQCQVKAQKLKGHKAHFDEKLYSDKHDTAHYDQYSDLGKHCTEQDDKNLYMSISLRTL